MLGIKLSSVEIIAGGRNKVVKVQVSQLLALFVVYIYIYRKQQVNTSYTETLNIYIYIYIYIYRLIYNKCRSQ